MLVSFNGAGTFSLSCISTLPPPSFPRPLPGSSETCGASGTAPPLHRSSSFRWLVAFVNLKYTMRQMDPMSSMMMPAMMILFCTTRRAIWPRILRLLPMLSSTPCSVSRACTSVSRCEWRSCRMETPISSVSSSVVLDCLMRSPVLLIRLVVVCSRSLCATEEPPQSSEPRPSSARAASPPAASWEAFLMSPLSLERSALYCLSFCSSGAFFSWGSDRASRSMRRTSASASTTSALASPSLAFLASPERLATSPALRAMAVESSQYSRS
mmetsp:Transcript_292/g.795  ORF Transcript_292/g.795 Transcript_292/m.795 type:complete len:269 (+) Transcript_292:51-857(+)